MKGERECQSNESLFLSYLPLAEGMLRIDPPLELALGFDDANRYVTATEESLRIDLAATAREELLELLNEEIDVQWRNYANVPDTELTPKARERKRALRKRLVG